MGIIKRIMDFLNDNSITGECYRPTHGDLGDPPGYVRPGRMSKGGHNDTPKRERPPDPAPIDMSTKSHIMRDDPDTSPPEIERLDKQELNIHGFDKTRRVYIRGYFDITRGLPSYKSRRRKKYL